MNRFEISRHADKRSVRESDVHFVLQHGTETAQGVLLTMHDVAAIEANAP
ncbi:MAG: hypothetical protein K0R27_748 [Xanthobacteraceae bacterium]|jgi:hypothetical protein|nr:hypothetical protein [Xanthobacteraceae bacterium]